MATQKFVNKTVIVTGASSGIGASTAIEFAKHGANLVLGGRNEIQLEDVKKKCLALGLKFNQVVTVIGDIVSDDVQHNLLDGAIKNFRGLDILVNNAGMGLYTPVLELNMDDFDRIYNVNMRAVVSLSLAALPHLIKSKGSIINVSSIASTRPLTTGLPYCISKASMDMFTKSLAFEVAPQGVRVNSVNPGSVVTNIGRDIKMDPEVAATRSKTFMQLQPLGRIEDPKEVAHTILFLSSEEASFVTGQIVAVCGGSSILAETNFPPPVLGHK